jgi:hypothetical protein
VAVAERHRGHFGENIVFVPLAAVTEFAETPAAASAVLPRDSYHRLQKIKATYHPDQAIIATHPVWPARH